MEIKWIYKKDKKGDRIQKWGLEREGNRFRSHEGLVDGTMSVGSWVECEGKNVGKANETSPEYQAELEANSRYKKKTDKGYSYDIDNCDRPFEPTLAHVLEDYKDDVVFPGMCSPKLDGIRCLYRNGKIFTRNNKEIVSCPHIVEAIKDDGLYDLELDGELYNHDLKDDFDKIISLSRKTKPTQEDLDESARIIQFHVFDCVEPPEDYIERYNYGERWMRLVFFLNPASKFIKLVQNILVIDWEGVFKCNEKNVSLGYEGSMLRWGNKRYENGRTKHLLKIKSFIDKEFEIVDLLEGRGKRQGTLGKWVIKLEDGTTNEVGPTGTDEQNKKYFLDKHNLIGKMLTVKFQGYTPDGKLRFPTAKTIRDYE